MKRLSVLSLLLIILLLPATAQTLLKGTVLNKQTDESVPFAVIALLNDSAKIVSNVQTNEYGKFSFSAKKPGKYTFRVSYIGFGTYSQGITISEVPDTIDFGVIRIASRESTLSAAEVTVTAARVEEKGDTTIYNASAYRTPTGSTLEALVKQLNGVEVSDDGTIKWNGQTIDEFLVNGKDYFKGNTDIAMKNLPVDLVSKIKAYEKKSDYTEQTGIDDGQHTVVLDITTKKELNESWITNLDVAAGTERRYSGRLFVSRFTDLSNISLITSANNVNDNNFGSPRGFGGGSGLTARKDANLSLSFENDKKKNEAGKLRFNSDISFSHSSTDTESRSSSEYFISTGSSRSFSNSVRKSMGSRSQFALNLNFRWTIDTLTNLSFRPRFSYSENENNQNSRNATFNSDPYKTNTTDPLEDIFASVIDPALQSIAVNRNYNRSVSDSKSSSLNARLNVTRKLSKAGRNLNLSLQGGLGDGKNNSYSLSDIKYFQSTATTSGTFQNRYNTTPSKNWNYSAQIGYVEPIVKKLFAEFRYQYSLRYTDSERTRYNLDLLADGVTDADGNGWNSNYYSADKLAQLGVLPSETDLQSVVDKENSRYATYKYYEHRANVGVRLNTDKIRFNASVLFNPKRTQLDYTYRTIDTLVTQNVFNVSPEMRFIYQFSRTDRLEFSYRGSASQPSMTDLLDVWDDSNPLNISGGNPGLKPSWTDNLNFNFRTYETVKQQAFNVGLNFSRTQNSISSRVVYDEKTGVRYSRPDNINGNWNVGGNITFNTGIGAQKLLTLSSYTITSYSNSVGYVSTTDATASSRALMGIFYTPRLLSGSGTTLTQSEIYNNLYKNATNLSKKNTTRSLNLTEVLNLSYRMGYFDFNLNGTVNYSHARATLVESSKLDTWRFSYGGSVNYTTNFGLSVSTNIRMNSRRGFSVSEYNTNELLWNVQIAQSFLANRNAAISLQLYDILRQQSNVSRSVSATSRSDTWSNSINSYAMLHFIYKFNFFGGTSRDNQRSNRRYNQDDRRDGEMPQGMPMGPPPSGGQVGGFRGGFGGGFGGGGR